MLNTFKKTKSLYSLIYSSISISSEIKNLCKLFFSLFKNNEYLTKKGGVKILWPYHFCKELKTVPQKYVKNENSQKYNIPKTVSVILSRPVFPIPSPKSIISISSSHIPNP